MPKFSFSKLDGTEFKSSDFTQSGILIINYFSPDCDHCSYMTMLIKKNIEKFKNTTILMIAQNDSATLSKFIADHELYKVSNLIVLIDKTYQFNRLFGTTVTPSFFIYNKNILKRKIIGETKLENLIFF